VDGELFLHYVIDVTEHLRMAASLRESEQRFRSTFEFAAAGITHTAPPDGRFVMVNPRFCEITGYSEDELLEMTFLQITHPDDRANDQAIKQRIFGGVSHTIATEKRYVRKDGSVVWVNRIVGLVRSPDGTVKHAVAVVEDIDGRKRAEAALRASERLFRNTFENAQAGIVHVSPQGHYRDANPRFCEIVGIGQEALRNMHYRDTTHPEDLDEDLELQRRFLAGEMDSHAREKRYLRKDGSTVWVNRTLGIVRKADGAPDYFVVVAEDITGRKRTEEALTRSRDQLRMLSTHIQDAVESERKRIAREIHDILGQGLMGLKLDTSWVADNLDGCRAAVRERMTDMTDAIDATIQTVKRLATELRPVLLDDLGLGAAIEWQSGDFQKRLGIACRVTIDPREIELDPARSTALFRIFQEMLSNIGRHAGASKVVVRLARTERAVTLSVSDNGVGIPPEKIGDSKSLGLIGMRERAHPFGGEIVVKRRRNGGTAVTARFPAEAEDGGR
jgi:two-component system sensor histidine kinase UhpB